MRRRRYPWLLAACVTASAALHALAFGLLPLARQAGEPSQVSVLDVVLARASTIPATPSEPVTRAPDARTPYPRPQPVEQRRPPPADAVPPLAPVSSPVVPQRIESLARAESSGANPLSGAESAAAPITAPSPPPTAVTPPVFSATYLRNPAPRYPLAARRNGEHGTVTLKVLVTREGVAAQVSLEHSSGSPQLDRAASDAVKNWRFMPARQGTQAVDAWVLVPVVFRLEG